MILLLNVFITHDRPHNPCNRFDAFKVTLKSYSKINWSKIYLRIKLDDEFQPRKTELVEWIEQWLPGADLKFERYEYQYEWKELIERVCSEDEFIWMTQNDDHVFVEEDAAYLETGLELMKKDPAQFKTLYFSHWPEILRLSGKLGPPERVGDWVKFKCTLLDSIQIWNANYLRFLFIDLDWCGQSFKRIDGLLFQVPIWGFGNILHSIQTLYVPLKELCRKFNGYVYVDATEAPPLTLDNYTCERTTENVRLLMRAPSQNSGWTANNPFRVPEEWINTSLRLYGLKT